MTRPNMFQLVESYALLLCYSKTFLIPFLYYSYVSKSNYFQIFHLLFYFYIIQLRITIGIL